MAEDSEQETMFQVGLAPTSKATPGGVPRIGDVIAEKYLVEKVLGSGGMGIVLAVRHMQLGEMSAIKCLHPRGASDPETVERFMREARAAVRIKSEHIARVSDVGLLDGGSPYMLMEHLNGSDLAAVLSEQGPLSIDDAVEYVLQACTGIAEAHALGIVHRDLKPANLFLTQRLDGPSLVKVLDFGISKALGDAGPHNPSLTQTASVFGSPAYMSPEQIRSAKNVDFRTDVWALGVILYELLAGQLPFKADTAGGLLSAIAADEPQRLRSYREEVSEELEAVVMRCLEKNVKKRFQTVSALADALGPFAGAKSLVSLGRIRRLSAPPSGSLPQLATRPSSAQSLAANAFGTTERAWITRASDVKGGRALTLLLATALLASLAVGGFFARRFLDVRAATPATSMAPPPPTLGDPTAATTEPTMGVAPLPTTSTPAASATPTATAKALVAARSAGPGSAKRPPSLTSPSTRASSSQVVPVPAPSTPASSQVPRDPTLDSH